MTRHSNFMTAVSAYGKNPSEEALEAISQQYLKDCAEAAAKAILPAETQLEIDGGRFEEWSLAELASQCRMQSRDQLDPEFSRFMGELHNRLSALAARTEDHGTEVSHGVA